MMFKPNWSTLSLCEKLWAYVRATMVKCWCWGSNSGLHACQVHIYQWATPPDQLLCVYTHACIFKVHVCAGVHMFAQTCVQRQRGQLNCYSSGSATLNFLETGSLLLAWNQVSSQGWPASELERAACIHFLDAGITSMCYHTQYF